MTLCHGILLLIIEQEFVQWYTLRVPLQMLSYVRVATYSKYHHMSLHIFISTHTLMISIFSRLP